MFPINALEPVSSLAFSAQCASVRVTLNGIPLSQTTNADGYTDFNFLPTGNLIFSASKDGYTPNQGTANTQGGQSASVVYITLIKK